MSTRLLMHGRRLDVCAENGDGPHHEQRAQGHGDGDDQVGGREVVGHVSVIGRNPENLEKLRKMPGGSEGDVMSGGADDAVD